MDTTILRRLSGEPKVRNFATIDIEARKWTEPYAVGFYDGSQYRDFVDYTFSYKSIDAALAVVLTEKYAGYWIYAHNGGNYDFTFFLRHIIMTPELRRKYLVDIIPIGSTVISFSVIEIDPGHHRKWCEDKKCRGCQPRKSNKRELKWTFVDSARLMPLPLEDIGKVFGTTKKVKLAMSYDELAQESNRQTMTHYLKVDCLSLYDAVDKMQRTINNLGGQLGITLPSTALDIFRRSHQREDIHTNRHYRRCPEYGVVTPRGVKPTCIGCMHDFIRLAYFGGRTEIYRMHFEPWTDRNGVQVDTAEMWDINSHYPACMLEPMPVGPAIELEGLDEKAVYSNARRMMGIVECDVYIPEDCYLPPLPVRVEIKGTPEQPHYKIHESDDGNSKLCFPTGYIHGTWDTAELVLLEKVGGRILKTYKSLWFETSPIFVRFIKQLYKFRDRKDPKWNEFLDFVAKICMNALYGKWAMKERRTKVVIHPSSPEGKKCINFEADVWAEDTIVTPLYIVPQLSVHVTSIARARLWEINWRVLKEGGRIYYNDTDSLVGSGAKLATGTDLGELKHEATIKRAVFALPKLYLIETLEKQKKKTREVNVKVKAKGLSPGIPVSLAEVVGRLGADEVARMAGATVKDVRRWLKEGTPDTAVRSLGIRSDEEGDDPLAGQLSEADFFDLVRRGVPIMRHRITKLKEALNAYAREATMFPRVISTPKQMKTQYNKRIVLSDYNTKPFSLRMFPGGKLN